MNVLVCDAIRARRYLRFVYEGYERIVEPHLYGINTASHEMLSAWLVAGWSASAPEPGWRNYLVREMVDLHVLSTPFAGPRPGYNPEDDSFRQVHCRLERRAVAPPEHEAPNADDLYHRGRELLEAGEAERALDPLQRSAVLEPHFKTLELLGTTLARLGRPLEAVVPLAAAATLHRQSRALALLAEVFLQLGRYGPAREMAERALANDPDHELAAGVLAEARRHLPAEE